MFAEKAKDAKVNTAAAIAAFKTADAEEKADDDDNKQRKTDDETPPDRQAVQTPAATQDPDATPPKEANPTRREKSKKKEKPADFGRTINEDGLNMGTHKTAMSTAIDARTYPLMFDPTCALRDPLVAISGTAIINAGAATTKNSLNPAKVAMLKQQALRNKGYLDPKLGQSHVGDITTLSPMDGGLNYLFRMAEDPHLRPYTDGAQLAL
ncbi:hypothetical protein MGG_09582 [Pyricularia oryzae 70-15]|uniref:Uncharacterized protein n=1 Tax=Pyricularia oryzae (strain 70-15 / ATCC MYA-4617 / FGSC 8958) TaxID=242507 RepID=G4NLG0_PYRO7|nr:uncharacterized protein MGG_09582 [Pyricularia oryzae 70-15]EHA46761.1 hypothetical protein MGG_09582 [Pyricularia oryzae 70-15]